jgi:hypothetical protein
MTDFFSPSRPRVPFKTLGTILLFLIAAAAIVGGYYYYDKYQKVLKDPEIITRQETEWLVSRVSTLMQLPQDETPSIATVIDKDKLKDQPFFKDCENGDKVLIYTKNQRAILYRPSSNKVIDVTQLSIDQTTEDGTDLSGVEAQMVQIAIYNGTNDPKLLESTEATLKDSISNIQVKSASNASRTDYGKTLVIDLTGSMSDQAKNIATALGGELSTLPTDESAPEADILIIIGK